LFSAYFRKKAHVHVASVDQLTYEEFIRSIPTPAAIAILTVEPLKGGAVFEIDPAVTHAMINRMFGGEGGHIQARHELTELELFVMEGIVQKMLGPLQKAWISIAGLHPRIEKMERMPQYCQIVRPCEMAILITFECTFGEVEGMINLCIPQTALNPVIDKLNAEFWYSGKQKDNGRGIGGKTLKEAINDIEVQLRVELGTRNTTLKEIQEMGEGSILELDKLAGDPVDIYANNQFVGRGEVVVIDENFGIRVTEVAGERK
jgi:flagellar motor switch protein FliM